jgi:hypothetical protein
MFSELRSVLRNFQPKIEASMNRRPARADCTCPPDKPVIPIVPSHIAKQRGHFGKRIKPMIEPPEAVPVSNRLRSFTEVMCVTPLLLKISVVPEGVD